MSEVVSVRVRKEVKETLEKAGINVAGKTREYFEELAWEARTSATLAVLRELIQRGVKPSAWGSSAKLVRLVSQDALRGDSFQISVDHQITLCDALLIAAAIHSKEELVTCDEKQANVGRKLGLRVVVLS